MIMYRRADDYQGEGVPNWNWGNVIQLKPGDEFAEAMEKGFNEIGFGEGMWAEYALPYRQLLLEAARDPYKRQTGWMTRIHPYTLKSGRVLLPLYSDGFNISLVALSDDNGDHWYSSLPIVGLGPTQPSFIQKKDGTVVAYIRDTGELPMRIQVSYSNDDGMTWTPSVDMDIPNPDSSLEVLELDDGTWLLICNDTEDGRHRLTAFLSDDEGATWKVRREIESAEPRTESFGYPSVIQDTDGLIHVTYSYHSPNGNCIRHATLNAEWIREGR